MMIPAKVFVVVAVVCFFTTNCFASRQYESNILLPTQQDEGKAKPWECCDSCVCTRSIPPQCRCRDQLIGGCHPECKKCDQLPILPFPPRYQCNDVIFDYCGPSCSTAK